MRPGPRAALALLARGASAATYERSRPTRRVPSGRLIGSVGIMRLIKYTHACVRLERAGGVLVIDPGVWSEPEVLDGAHAVLVTHEHFDHVDVDRLRAICATNPDLHIWTNTEMAAQLADLGDAVTAVASGETFEAAGFSVRACGDRHAFTYEKLPDVANLGFVVDGIYHPGDAFAMPVAAVETLLVPTSGPWMKIGEAVEFVRTVAPRRAYSIHDALFNDRGLQIVDRWLADQGTDYSRLELGSPVDL